MLRLFCKDSPAFDLKSLDDALQRICLMKLDIGVGVTVLDSGDKAADSRHTEKVPFGLLVGVLRVLLVAGDELMVEVEVEVDAVARIELLGSLEKPEHQRVEFVCSVEVVCDVIVVHVGGVVATEASECPLDGVGTRNPDVVVAVPEAHDVQSRLRCSHRHRGSWRRARRRRHHS